MLSFTFEFILIASSNSHILFCFCNLIIAILLLGSSKTSSKENNNTICSQLSKKRKSLGTSRTKHLDCDTCIKSQEMQRFSILRDTSTLEVHRDINQDDKSDAYDNVVHVQYYEFANRKQYHHQDTSFKCENVKVHRDINQDTKSGAYDNVAHVQYYESANHKQYHHQDTSFKCENVEKVSANGTVDRNISIDKTKHLAKMNKKGCVNSFDQSDEKEEDELRKRIEDFIEKINRGWREEKLRMCYQSQYV